MDSVPWMASTMERPKCARRSGMEASYPLPIAPKPLTRKAKNTQANQPTQAAYNPTWTRATS